VNLENLKIADGDIGIEPWTNTNIKNCNISGNNIGVYVGISGLQNITISDSVIYNDITMERDFGNSGSVKIYNNKFFEH